MKKRTMLFILGLSFLFCSHLWAKDYKVVCVFSGGSKGYLEADGKAGGLAQKVTLVKKLKRDAESSKNIFVALDSGNTIGPFFLSRLEKGKTILSAMADMGYQAMSPGDHEFGYGQNYFLSLATNKIPFLCANLYKDKKSLGKRSLLLTDQGLKIGIFGLTSPAIAKEVSGYALKDITIQPLVKEARAVVAELKKQGASLIICVGFLEVKEAHKIAEAVPEINLLIRNYHGAKPIGGTENYELGGAQGRAIIVAPQNHNQSVGIATLQVRETAGKIALHSASIGYLAVTRDLAADEGTKKAIEALKVDLEKRIGVALLPFAPSEGLPSEFKAASFAKMMAAILREQLHTEVAILNTNLFNEEELHKLSKKKTMSYLDLERIFHARGKISIFTLKGSEIADIVNKLDPEEPLAFSGVEKKGGAVLINGIALRGGDNYWVASVKYLASGTTGYPQFKGKGSEIDRFRIGKDYSVRSNAKGLDLSVQDSFSAYTNHLLKELGRGPNGSPFKSQVMDTLEREEPTYLFIFDNLRLTYSATKTAASSLLAATVPDSRASAKNQETMEIAGRFIFIRQTSFLLWENKLGFAYAQTDLEGQKKNVSNDDLYIESDASILGLGFDLWVFKMAPYFSVKYDTELEKDSGKPLEKIFYFSLGAAGVSAGPFTKLKFGALGKADFTGGKDTVHYGLLGQMDFSKKFWDTFTVDSQALVYYFPNQGEDKVGDLKVRLEWNTVVKMPFWKEFFFVMELRVFAFQAKKTTSDWGSNIAFSVGISYSKAWKFIYEPFFGRK